jgi:hypothetical protein
MKQALILGCSHAYGSEIFPWPQETHNHSYPAIIARELGYTVNNLAIPGGSNDAIFRLFEEHRQTANLVIACWSGYNRSEIWNNQINNWQALAPGKEDIGDPAYLEYQKQWVIFHTDTRVGRLNKAKNILAVNASATQPVININSFWPVTNFVWPDTCYWPVSTTFWDWCLENNYPKTAWGHFFEPAHQAFAEFILKNIKLS